MMFKKTTKIFFGVILIATSVSSCKSLSLVNKIENRTVPESYNNSQDTSNTATVIWKDFFKDPYLVALIDTALQNNQELNITLQEIQIYKNEIGEKKGEYLPFLSLQAGAGAEKVSRYTRNGAVEATTDIEPGKEFPEPLPDYYVGLNVTWEIDIWKKLRNAKKAAVSRYLSSVEGTNFMITNLVTEIATSYYELMALDNQLLIINQNINIQSDALEIVKLQKQASRLNELAVKRFEAQLLNTKGLQYEIKQQIVEVENRINFLVGRFPQPVLRSAQSFDSLVPNMINTGIPSQLLTNRPDIKQAEMELEASKLDVKVARAKFFPSIGISAGVGLQSFNPGYLIKTPEALLYNVAGDLLAPLLNRKAIKAEFNSAKNKQIQAIYEYEQTILNGYIEVYNGVNRISNLDSSYQLKNMEVEALTQSITISNNLFKSARADYMEVLLTQREALDSRFELVELKMKQLIAMVKLYQALGGGWR